VSEAWGPPRLGIEPRRGAGVHVIMTSCFLKDAREEHDAANLVREKAIGPRSLSVSVCMQDANAHADLVIIGTIATIATIATILGTI